MGEVAFSWLYGRCKQGLCPRCKEPFTPCDGYNICLVCLQEEQFKAYRAGVPMDLYQDRSIAEYY